MCEFKGTLTFTPQRLKSRKADKNDLRFEFYQELKELYYNIKEN